MKHLARYALVFWLSYCPAVLLAASGQCMLWEVKNATQTLYLAGSIHLGRAEMYPLDACYERAFRRAQVLAVELNVAALSDQDMMVMMQNAAYTDGRRLAQTISAETYSRLKAYLQKSATGARLATFEQTRPWFIAQMLPLTELMRLGYTPEHGTDMYFINKAGDDKEVIALETLAEQMAALAGGGPAAEEEMLRQTLEDMPRLPALTADMLRLWNAGDAQGLLRLATQGAEDKPARRAQVKRLLDDRNLNMANKISQYFKSPKPHFVIVGSAHLSGPAGVLALLEKRGYSLKQVPQAGR